MGERTVDARGLECPKPVLLTRDAIKEGSSDAIHVIVDNKVSSENVKRMAESQGWNAEVKKSGDNIEVLVTRGEGAVDPEAEAGAMVCPTVPGSQPNVVVLLASNLFGTGEEELGVILMRAFVKTLKEVEPAPSKVIFANSGVRLTTEGSELIEDIRALEEAGAEVISCGTCLDYYGLKEKLEVGRASNMFEIATSLAQADRLVRP